MKKKTIKKKGGNSIISNIIGNKTGPFIPENLNTEIDLGNQNVIINKYKRIKEDAENEYIDAENRLNKSTNESINTAKRFQIFIKNILGPFIHTLINYFAIVFSFMWDKILVKFGYILKYLFENFVNFFIYIGYIFRDLFKARGVILVLLVLIVTIILIIYAFYGGNMPNPFKGNPILQNTKNQITIFKENIPDSPYSIL
jgi:hypothetical protein